MRLVVCPYCLNGAELVGGKEIYGRLCSNDYVDRKFWLCRKCWAYVGTHPGTTLPLGTLANEELRRWRRQAHLELDPLWRGKSDEKRRRQAVYASLANFMDLPESATHIAKFDVDGCKRAIEAVRMSKEILEMADDLAEAFPGTPEGEFAKLKKGVEGASD